LHFIRVSACYHFYFYDLPLLVSAIVQLQGFLFFMFSIASYDCTPPHIHHPPFRTITIRLPFLPAPNPKQHTNHQDLYPEYS
jgi:hypothetical protein